MLIFYKKILYIYYFIKAKEYLFDENILEALEAFSRAEKYYNDDYQLYIYKGLCEFLLKLFDDSLLSFQKALKMVHADKKLSSDEKNYLKKFIIEHLLDILRILRCPTHNYDEYKNVYNGLKFNKNRINKNLFYDFPLEKDS